MPADVAGHGRSFATSGGRKSVLTPDEGNLKHALAHKYSALYNSK